MPDGTIQKIGWVLINEAGDHYCPPEHPGAALTGFVPEQMQRLADELNAGPKKAP
ncbi:hypothetical protein [Luteimonas sp. A501]